MSGYPQLCQRPYPVSFHERQKIQEEIDKLIKQGVLMPALIVPSWMEAIES
jgi:hypothetical protein